MGALSEVSLAIIRAKQMIRDSLIGEDAHGETWIKVEEGWRRLDRLTRDALSPEQEAGWNWLNLALTALFQAGELMADETTAVELPGVPGNNLWLYKLI